MKRLRQIFIANELLLANLVANTIGSFIIEILLYKHFLLARPSDLARLESIDRAFTPLALLTIICLTLIYEWPIRRYLKILWKGGAPDARLTLKARRRLLNEPYMVAALNFAVWFFGSLIFWHFGMFTAPAPGVACGIITVILAYFWTEHLSQFRLVPLLFPLGELSKVSKVFPKTIGTYILALVTAVSVVPLLFVHVTISTTAGWVESGILPLRAGIEVIRDSVAIETMTFLCIGVIITIIVSENLRKPIKGMIRVLSRIKRGDYDQRTSVVSNDEIGYAGEVVNQMAVGLKEREALRQSLALAREVQQTLLPKGPPSLEAWEIAAVNRYCDETGGDYYDYFPMPDGSTGLVVGDVTGHGIQAALLMASTRGFIRQRAALPGTLAEMISDVNHQLVRDAYGTGRFMTLFWLTLGRDHRLSWVRAGHDPALVLNPETGQFRGLGGMGMALGVLDGQGFEDRSTRLNVGHALVLATDGIWEAENNKGEMFGKMRFKKALLDASPKGAQAMVDEVMKRLEVFQAKAPVSDDQTLMVAVARKPHAKS